jgi:diguanylate cyclase (GGDEF)-like protein
VVDDEPAIRLLARITLEESGFVVEEAPNGEDAIRAIERFMPDVILLDVMLPGSDGFSVCRHLSSSRKEQPYAVVMMTGLDDHDSIQRAYDLGATDFMIKPINWHVLGYRAKYIARATQAVKDLHSSQARLRYAQQVARLGSWEWLVDEDIFVFSDIFSQIFEIRLLQQEGRLEDFLALVHRDEQDFVRAAFQEAARTGAPVGIDTRIVIADSADRFVHIEAGVAAASGEMRKLLGTVQDITDRKRSENQIRSLAYYDVLTGLANRLQFNECLETAIAAAAEAGRKAALIFLDLDRFKIINDTLGHDAGDLLLKQVAMRLKHCLRKGDCVSRNALGRSTVSRLGGDEFTMVLENIASDEEAAKVARRIINDVEKPIELAGREVFVTASLGISLFPDDGAEANTLTKNADSAMYHAKALGGNTFQFYSASMNESAVERLAMEGALRKALERGEFLLFYQPQVNTETEGMVAVEALVRWQHPEKGLLSPGLFIPLAEESGLITAIDNWVVAAACSQIRSWQDAGVKPIRVAVNLSGRDFMQNKVLNMVEEALLTTGIDPGYLELEITEGVLMKNADEAIRTLHALKEMGLKLSIDDFGTGYSSLSYLQRFPLDMLKIDRSFVSDVTTNSNNAAIVTAIIGLATSLSLEVLAEGVETEEQRSFLESHRCSVMQGYLFSTPIAADAMAKLLENSKGPVVPLAPSKPSIVLW